VVLVKCMVFWDLPTRTWTVKNGYPNKHEIRETSKTPYIYIYNS